MRALVVGAAGFVGSALVKHLAEVRDEVVAVDSAAPQEVPQGVRVVTMDAVHGDLPVEGMDAVFYLAQSPAYRQFPEQAGDLLGVNVVGAVRACAAARAAGARCFLYASSGNVYAPSFAMLGEEAPVRRDEPYALSKVMAEDALALFRPSLRVIIARLFGVFGPGQRTMLPVTLRQRIERGEPIVLQPAPGEPSPTGGLRISFTFVSDVAIRMRYLAAQAIAVKPLPEVINLAGPSPISIREFATAIARVLGREPRFELQDAPRPFDLHADISRLAALCPCEFTSFDTAIRASLI